MYNGFKYLELTRHHIFRKAKEIIHDYSKQEGADFNKLEEAVFSSTLSAFLTALMGILFANNSEKPMHIWMAVCLLFLAIIIYCILFVGISKAYSCIAIKAKNLSYFQRVHSPAATARITKELIDDFDHITFDHLIVAFELLDEIDKSNIMEIRTFCFHEVLYYLKTSVQKTKEITNDNRRNECLNIFGNTRGVDIFRLINAQKMMSEIIDRAENVLKCTGDSQKIQVYDEFLEMELAFQVSEIRKSIETIEERCKQAVHDLRPTI